MTNQKRSYYFKSNKTFDKASLIRKSQEGKSRNHLCFIYSTGGVIFRGQVTVYTGNGKGKTTAAIGDALCRASAGSMVYMGQFMKGIAYSETKILCSIPEILVEQYGSDTCLISPDDVSERDIAGADAGMEKIGHAITSGAYELVILDEVIVSVWFGLVKLEHLIGMINNKPHGTELILTGRYAPEELTWHADRTVDFREIKHYYMKGVPARDGIER